jgi:hypothetical protein
MEARRIAVVLAAVLASLGASARTPNFVVTAPTVEFAQTVGQEAERCRRELAREWLGQELPRWPEPCPITVHVGPQLGAGGATSFAFHHGQPFGWTMTIQGSSERILDSVLPHEITHTIFATYFGRPLPRWADEGACTTVEHVSERTKQHQLLLAFLVSGRGIAFSRMFAMKEYPHDVLPLYAQGYSLARYLIAQRGKQAFIQYLGEGMRHNNWSEATKRHYGFGDLSELQISWLDWVRRGCSPRDAQDMLAARLARPTGGATVQLASLTPSGSPDPLADKRRDLDLGGSTEDSWYAQQRSRVNRLASPSSDRTERTNRTDRTLGGGGAGAAR